MTDNFARLLALTGGNGGSGGTTDYETLDNKPSIGGTTLIGDLTLAELGIIVDDQLNLQSTNPVQNAVLTALLNAFPYSNVTGKPQINGVTLTGNITLDELGLNAIWVGTQAEYAAVESTLAEGTLVIITDDQDVDNVPTQNSTNLVTSGGIYAFVVGGYQTKIDSQNKLDADLVDDTNAAHKFATSGQLSQIATNATNIANKVDKVNGKGLSTEDFTTAEKTKLSGVETEANKTVVDSALSESSTNPVQNKVVTENLNDKYPKAWDVELTQAEYDALPASKYVDGKNYYITDGDSDKPIIYGFHVDPDESDPSDAVTYLMDAVGMEPASMGATSFNYGSWKNAFFMPKPCMLKYDGTVDYYLDPNDFTKKVDGTASDVGNINYAGNAMMEFPKIWFKFEAGTADGEGYFYVSNQKVDDTYRCWCNMDADGNEIDHFYVHIYNGVIYDGKMRSLSGVKLSPWSTTAYSSSATYAVNSIVNYDGKMWKCVTAVETAEEFDSTKWEQFAFNGNTDGTQEVNSATANNTTAKSEWYIDTWCDRVLITALLYLIGKSLNLQGTFGRGIDSGSQTAAEAYVTGAANDKGLFYGSTSNGSTVVKVFGIENFWAYKWHRTAGLFGNANGGYNYKMTASTADGSQANGYNINGVNYLTTIISRPSSGYISKIGFGEHGLLPVSTINGSSSKYYCDYFYTGTGFALVGGSANHGAVCGFYVYLGLGVALRGWDVAAALSCKPLANKEV